MAPALLARPQLPYHPCMDDSAHGKVARIHLPVAPKCNLQCAYCRRDVRAEALAVSGPGTSSGIMTAQEALFEVDAFLLEWGEESVVGIAGPGDPLANPESLETLRLVHEEHPRARTCLCTNGLALPEHVDELIAIGLESLSVTVNGVTPGVVAGMQPWIAPNGRLIHGEPGAAMLIERQREGVRRAVAAGISVKINMVVAPDINGFQAEAVAKWAANAGACVFNPIPLLPRAAMRHESAPPKGYMKQLRETCARHLPVFSKCKQCRADAQGVPGKESCPCETRKTA